MHAYILILLIVLYNIYLYVDLYVACHLGVGYKSIVALGHVEGLVWSSFHEKQYQLSRHSHTQWNMVEPWIPTTLTIRSSY